MRIWKIAFLLSVIIWPLNLMTNNSVPNFLSYIIPAFLVSITLFAINKNYYWFELPLVFIPLIEPKLVLIPFIFIISNSLHKKKIRTLSLILFVTTLLIFLLRLNTFYGQTILVPDYEARQKIIRNSQLYPNIPLARLFQNKVVIVTEKFFNNIYTLIDPNNYFFGNAPRQISGNQNFVKFPFLSIIIALIYFINIKKLLLVTPVFFLLISSIVSLALLTNFDRHDILIWPFFTIFLLKAFKFVSAKTKQANILFTIYIAFTFIEILRIFVLWI